MYSIEHPMLNWGAIFPTWRKLRKNIPEFRYRFPPPVNSASESVGEAMEQK
jgi:hypothetical protein